MCHLYIHIPVATKQGNMGSTLLTIIIKRLMKINMKKAKLMVIGSKARDRIHLGRWTCGCYGREVGGNYVVVSLVMFRT